MKASILKTLVYADIFDYPLTRAEIHHWSIGPSSSASPITHPHIQSLKSYFFLKSRRSLVALRINRQRASFKKLQLARRVGEWLKFIPTIKLVAVTGALAMRNSDRHDDIDLLIITAPNTLWLTRIFVVGLISLLAHRRHPGQTTSLSNNFCLNLFLDLTAITMPPSQRNLFTAHEVAQVKLLWDRDDTYHHFLSANSWINHYLPNIKIRKSLIINHKSNPLFSFFNRLAFRLQYFYMRPRLTREKVSLHSAFFHPQDTAGQVMRQYHHRLAQLGLHP